MRQRLVSSFVGSANRRRKTLPSACRDCALSCANAWKAERYLRSGSTKRQGKPPRVGPEDGYRATELVEACYRAVRQEGPVRLPLPEPAAA